MIEETAVSKVSQYFTLAEATMTQHRGWIDANRLHAERYMHHVLTHGRETMDQARRILNEGAVRDLPVLVSSWVRCRGLNSAVGGSDHSDHVIGPLFSDQSIECVGATDFSCPSFGSAYDVARKLSADSALEYRQLIYEFTWVHISSPRMVNGVRERPLRQVLTLKPGGGYVQGIKRMSDFR
jgi:hypothetical protein